MSCFSSRFVVTWKSLFLNRHNTALQTAERRTSVTTKFNMVLAPLATERQAVSEMAIIINGETRCSICEKTLIEGDDLVATTHFIGDRTDPLWRQCLVSYTVWV
jgi:hypothetical protein